jgi:hypothetical protein
MSQQEQELNTVIPDLNEVSLERLAELGDSVLAQSIALYRKRLKETRAPLNSFSARILGIAGSGRLDSHHDRYALALDGRLRRTCHRCR